MRLLILPIAVGFILFQSCGAIEVKANESPVIQALSESMFVTPHCALIKAISVDVISIHDNDLKDDQAEEVHVYKAAVIDTYRGLKMKHISYTMLVEKGEKPIISKEPYIITLCKSKEGYYWPGVGSKFPASEEIVKMAKTVGKKLSTTQKSFSGCD